MSDVAERIDELHRSGLHRELRLVEGPQGPRVVLDGREVLLLCSSNYLGLADHPRVRQAAADAAERSGAGAGGSRLASGGMTVHRALERRLAEFTGAEAALLLGSGYLASIATIGALAGSGQVVFSDQLNHPSIVDGCRLSRAKTFVYRHRDTEHLAWGLERAGERAALIVTDGVFSMDGDVAPLPELVELARRHGCLLCVDEAHGTGAVGPGGRGAVAAAELGEEVDVIVGTLGKALGSYGAYVCSRTEVIELLVSTARPLMFSTALPPPAVAAALASLSLLASQPGVVEQLRRNATELRGALRRHGLDTGPSRTQIVPVMVGDARRTMTLGERALERGVFAEAIRPPTVPEGACRLRLTAMANHRADELHAAAGVVAAAARELGIVDATRASEPPTELRQAA